MKQTAVEWFANAIKGLDTSVSYYFFQEMLEQAKEMEKQQQGYSEEDMKEAFKVGFNVGYNDNESPSYLTFEEWFNKYKIGKKQI